MLRTATPYVYSLALLLRLLMCGLCPFLLAADVEVRLRMVVELLYTLKAEAAFTQPCLRSHDNLQVYGRLLQKLGLDPESDPRRDSRDPRISTSRCNCRHQRTVALPTVRVANYGPACRLVPVSCLWFCFLSRPSLCSTWLYVLHAVQAASRAWEVFYVYDLLYDVIYF